MYKTICFAVMGLMLGFNCQPAICQPSNGIQLKKGQSFQMVTTAKIENTVMGMSMNNNTHTTSKLTVYDENEKYYWAKDSVIRMKAELDIMGQQSSYDSDNPEKSDEQVKSMLGDKQKFSDSFYIDKASGSRTSIGMNLAETRKMIMESTMQPTDSENDKVANQLFLVIPAGSKKGDSWKDSVISKSIKNHITYTIESIDEKRATVKVQSVSTMSNTGEKDGSSFEMTMQSDTKGTLLVDMASKMVLEKLLETAITGDFSMMGQNLPMNVTSVTTQNITPL